MNGRLYLMVPVLLCGLFAGPNVTFVLVNTPMTWIEAQNHCRAEYTDLASVRNLAENQEVLKLVPPNEHVWIGLFRDSWKWSDGSRFSLRNWGLGQPHGGTKFCVSTDVQTSGGWVDNYCSLKQAFICFSPQREF